MAIAIPMLGMTAAIEGIKPKRKNAPLRSEGGVFFMRHMVGDDGLEPPTFSV